MDNEETYWNQEEDDKIICPYCGEEYEPSYEDLFINNEQVDCYTEDTEIYKCDVCGKRFEMFGFTKRWFYHTETIDGEMTQEEWENTYG